MFISTRTVLVVFTTEEMMEWALTSVLPTGSCLVVGRRRMLMEDSLFLEHRESLHYTKAYWKWLDFQEDHLEEVER